MAPRATEPPCIFPTLRCQDAEALIAWLTGLVGFREQAVHRNGEIVEHAELALGSSILMLGQKPNDDREDAYGALVNAGAGRRTDALYVAVADADALHATLAAAGTPIVTALRDTPYGSREFACRDPEGNLWSFGTYWPKVGGAGEA
jgi:uncharacterized glyoxalase superfamily protein PhnB